MALRAVNCSRVFEVGGETYICQGIEIIDADTHESLGKFDVGTSSREKEEQVRIREMLNRCFLRSQGG